MITEKGKDFIGFISLFCISQPLNLIGRAKNQNVSWLILLQLWTKSRLLIRRYLVKNAQFLGNKNLLLYYYCKLRFTITYRIFRFFLKKHLL